MWVGTLPLKVRSLLLILPGLERDYFGFLGWKQHQPNIWLTLLAEAEKRREEGLKVLPNIVGYDVDAEAIKVAFANIERAGMLGKIHVEKRDVSLFVPKANVPSGLVVVNPPYGERLGEIEELQPLYVLLAERLKQGLLMESRYFTGNPI